MKQSILNISTKKTISKTLIKSNNKKFKVNSYIRQIFKVLKIKLIDLFYLGKKLKIVKIGVMKGTCFSAYSFILKK